MIAAGLLVSLVVSGLVGMGVAAVLPERLVRMTWFPVLMLAGITCVVLAAAFFDFHRRRTINTVYSSSGVIHLVPRGVHRIRFGREA